MTHLNQTELHAHRTSCLAGGEFPCHEDNLPEPYDPLWDEGFTPYLPNSHIRWRKVLRSD